MRVLIATTFEPFVRGGGTTIESSLGEALQAHGHQVDHIRIPTITTPVTYLQEADLIRNLNVRYSVNQPDKVICIRPPSFALQHPEKVIWFIHVQRQIYEHHITWNSKPIFHTFESEQIHYHDHGWLTEAKAIYANSKISQDRLKLYHGLDSTLVYPPLPLSLKLTTKNWSAKMSERLIVMVCRINPVKRQQLAVQALRYLPSDVRLVLVGTGDAPAQDQWLQNEIEKAGVKDRVILTGYVSDEEKIQWLNRASVTLYLAKEEDSYGYSTLEAMSMGIPVVTFTDSGGVLELVTDGETGVVCQPDPQALAVVLGKMLANKQQLREMGERAIHRVQSMDISWERVVRTLLSQNE